MVYNLLAIETPTCPVVRAWRTQPARFFYSSSLRICSARPSKNAAISSRTLFRCSVSNCFHGLCSKTTRNWCASLVTSGAIAGLVLLTAGLRSEFVYSCYAAFVDGSPPLAGAATRHPSHHKGGPPDGSPGRPSCTPVAGRGGNTGPEAQLARPGHCEPQRRSNPSGLGDASHRRPVRQKEENRQDGSPGRPRCPGPQHNPRETDHSQRGATHLTRAARAARRVHRLSTNP